jgi:phage tail sheath protein FI
VLLCYRTVPTTVANGGQLVDPLNPANAADPQREEPDVVEEFDDLGVDPLDSDFVLTSLREAMLVTAKFEPATLTPSRPDDTGIASGERTYLAAAGGASGIGGAASLPAAMTIDDFRGTAATAQSRGSGLSGLTAIDQVSLLAVPDEGHSGVNATVRTGICDAIVQQCEERKDRFGILQLIRDAGGGDPANVTPPASTTYAAVYYPWVRVRDPATGSRYLVPPSGHVAGVYARTDMERGVHRAPANAVVHGIVPDVSGAHGPLAVDVTEQQQDVLNARGVNVIRDFRVEGRGIRVWGARTLADSVQWRYVNVRRFFIFLEKSIEKGTRWVVFEPNDEPTWALVRRSISNFLTVIWRTGALRGATPEEAFFVRCDRTTMNQDDIDNGRLICHVGIAPVRPAEFEILRFSQETIEIS